MAAERGEEVARQAVGLKLASAIVPPGRQTRSSSRAAARWSGANITPNADVTTSKRAVGERQRLGVGLDPVELDPARVGRGAPAARFSGVRSEATTSAPASAARTATLPVPAATSSTRMPGPMPAASTTTGPTSQTSCVAKR